MRKQKTASGQRERERVCMCVCVCVCTYVCVHSLTGAGGRETSLKTYQEGVEWAMTAWGTSTPGRRNGNFEDPGVVQGCSAASVWAVQSTWGEEPGKSWGPILSTLAPREDFYFWSECSWSPGGLSRWGMCSGFIDWDPSCHAENSGGRGQRQIPEDQCWGCCRHPHRKEELWPREVE